MSCFRCRFLKLSKIYLQKLWYHYEFFQMKTDIFSPLVTVCVNLIYVWSFWKKKWHLAARDIHHILLFLGHFVIKKVPIKNCWHFLKNFTSTLKSSFRTFGNFSEHITHWKNFQILIYKTLKIGKSTFFTNFPKSSNFICL